MPSRGPLFKTIYCDIKRSKVYHLLLLFALLMIASSNIFTFFTREEELKIIKDIGLMSINVFGLLFILFSLSHYIPREIEDRTIYTILTNPASRTSLLLANLGAHLYVLLLGFFAMAAIFYGVLYMKEGAFSLLMMKGVIIIYMKMVVFSSIVLLFSIFFTPIMNITCSLFFYIGGHLTNYLSSLADKRGFLGWCFLKAIYTILPNFENFNCSDALALGADVSWRYIWALCLYSILYGGSIFLLSIILFEHREI